MKLIALAGDMLGDYDAMVEQLYVERRRVVSVTARWMKMTHLLVAARCAHVFSSTLSSGISASSHEPSR